MPCIGFVFENAKHHSWCSVLAVTTLPETSTALSLAASRNPISFKYCPQTIVSFLYKWIENLFKTWTEFMKYYSDSFVTAGQTKTCRTECKILPAKKISKLNKLILFYFPAFWLTFYSVFKFWYWNYRTIRIISINHSGFWYTLQSITNIFNK